jgi:signal transduction histidine kinase
LGLAEALRVYVRQWSDHVNIAAEFHSEGLEKERPSPEIENNLYRIGQEALNNVAKHSGASRVDVLLERRDGHAVLIVEDNGRGFSLDDQTDASAIGLTGIRERASLLGGSMELETAPDKGTTLIVRIPLNVGVGRGYAN